MSVLQFKTELTSLVLLGLISSFVIANDHPCYRTCVQNQPMECIFNFTLEYYYSMSKACYDCPFEKDDCSREDCVAADGTKRPLVTVNRQMPGPSIEVCQGDTITVNVQNNILSEDSTIHWHGQHQIERPYMDGVPYITQCPIQSGTTFTYRFLARQVGTQFWHSHSGIQRGDGMFGPLIVRQPADSNPHIDLYDYDLSEHVIVAHDWTENSGIEKFLYYYHAEGDNKPTSILVNGKGRFEEFTAEDGTPIHTPLARFIVDEGYRYRFRFINNGILNCPLEISVDGHTMSVISTDGSDLVAIEVESFVMYAGERYDVVINANQEPGLYWIRFRGLIDCAVHNCHQEAVLQYSGFSDDDYPIENTGYDEGIREGLQINSVNVGMELENGTLLSVASLNSVSTMDDNMKGTPDFQYVVEFSVNGLNNPMFHKENAYGFSEVNAAFRSATPQINHISMSFKSFPLLPGRYNLDQDSFCNVTTLADSDCSSEICSCTYVEQIPLNSLVELIFVDTGATSNHLIHLHGYTFRVIGMEHLGGTVNKESILELEASGSLRRNFDDPPLKDTVNVPASGYTIVRFIANNPGFWFMHCHLEFHTALGMGLVFKVGENDDMVTVPDGFPQCGNAGV